MKHINIIYIKKYFLLSLLIFLVMLIITITIFNKLKITTTLNNITNYNTLDFSKYITTNNYSLNNYLTNYNLEKYYSKKDIHFLLYQYNNKKLLSFTFDDGPSKNTLKLLNILNKNNIPATFFVIGNKIEKNKEILKRENIKLNEIGIHSYDHKILTKLTDSEIEKNINKTNKLIEEITNKKANLIRVPYGITNKHLNELLSNNDYINIKWTVDSLDWKLKNKDKILNNVKKQIKGNDIILMHDIYDESINAAELIIEYYKKRNYTFVNISTLLKIKTLINN